MDVESEVYTEFNFQPTQEQNTRAGSEINSLLHKLQDHLEGGLVLDIGCGDAKHSEFIRSMGYDYLGVDITGDGPDILADGCELPLQSNSVDAVISVATLEHVQDPPAMASEVCRVLKPDGLFIGTVAFMEEMHGHSFYHMTHHGVTALLENAGLTPSQIAPIDIRKELPGVKWDGPVPQSRALFYGLPRQLQLVLTLLVYIPHRFLFSIVGPLLTDHTREDLELRRRYKLAGQFGFVAKLT